MKRPALLQPTLRRLLALLAVLALLGGCGGSDPGSASSEGTSGGAASMAVTVTVAPDLAFYPLGSEVKLTAVVRDSTDKAIPNAKVTWTRDPEDAAKAAQADGTFTLEKPGKLTFKGCTVDEGNGKPACGEAIIEVPPKPPVLVVTKPQPGDELGGQGATTFTVEGKVTSTRATHVFVDGVDVHVAKDGSFTTDVPAFFGVNHLIVSADDGENAEVRSELDVAFGASYAPATDATGAPSLSVPDALVLQLGQRFFDDGIPVPLGAPHPVTLPDLADIVERIIAGLDVLGQIPNPILSGSTITLQATSATLDDITVEATLVDDGLDLFVRVGTLSLGTAGFLQVSNTTIGLDGGINAALSAYAHASITKASPADPVVVNVSTFDVVVETATGAFTDPQANAIFALASGFLRTTLEQQLQSGLSGALQTTVPQTLEGVFQSLDTALANKTIPIDAAPLPKVVVTLDGHLSQLDIVPLDRMQATLSLAIATDQTTATHPTSRGVALVDTSTEDPLFDSPRSQLGVRLLVINGLLHDLWNSGLLEVPVSSSIPLQISGKLPPIVRLPRKDETDDLVVSLGELEAVPNGQASNGKLGILLESGLNIDLQGDTLTLKLSDTPKVTVWNIKEPAGPAFFTPELLQSLLSDTLWPTLKGGIESATSITLPIPPLDSIATLAPSLTGLELTTGLNQRVAYRSGFLVLDVDIAATLP